MGIKGERCRDKGMGPLNVANGRKESGKQDSHPRRESLPKSSREPDTGQKE
jgi:hypothetical protein